MSSNSLKFCRTRKHDNSYATPEKSEVSNLPHGGFRRNRILGREVAIKWLALSAQLGPPTFSRTVAMNPDWLDHKALNRGAGSCSDSAMSAVFFKLKLASSMKFMQSDQFYKHQAMVSDFRRDAEVQSCIG
jgi:hypothetical protein